ncbi:MAG: ZIP family metal transporter [Verrucomicrobiota bacterium]|jgi:zinc and cadmium transporter
MNPSLTYLLLFLSVAVGVLLVLMLRPEDKQKIKLLISFSGAYVFAVTVLHLLPEVYRAEVPNGHDHDHAGGHWIGLLILAGFFLQLLLEYFSHGIEHGHAHTHHFGHIPVGMMTGLCIHAFVEGMPLGGVAIHPGMEHSQRMLLAGIVMHNIPVSIVLFSMLLHNGIARNRALALMFAFALMSPLGMLASDLIAQASRYTHELMALVIGIFLHISTTILFESSEEHRYNRRKVVAIAVGAAVAILTSSLPHH